MLEIHEIGPVDTSESKQQNITIKYDTCNLHFKSYYCFLI